MKQCRKCGVRIEDGMQNCPLCGAFLTDDAEQQTLHAYPPVKRKTRGKIAFKILMFLSALGIVVPVGVNLAVQGTVSWAWHVVFGIALVWFTVGRGICKHFSARKQIAWDAIGIVALCFYLEAVTKSQANHWAFTLATPIVVLVVATVHEILFFADRGGRGNYAIALARLCVLSAICIGISFAWLGECGWGWYVCTARGLVDVLALSIFARKTFAGELRRRLHF